MGDRSWVIRLKMPDSPPNGNRPNAVLRINEEIGVDDLAAARPRIEPGDIVAIDTGWSERWGTPEWNRHPYLSLEAAQWLVDQKVKLVAVDTATPDLPYDLRPEDFQFP